VQGVQEVQGVHGHHVESEIGRGYGPMSLKAEAASMRARYVLESGDWAEMKGRSNFDNVDELSALGIASVKLGDLDRAQAAYEQMKNARDAAPDADNKRVAQIMMAEPAGLAALADGARIEATMPKPIARPYPVKRATETYAEALLAAGKAGEAMAQYQAALARTPRRAQALLGLAKAQDAAGQHAAAAKTARDFIAMWHLADATRQELREARTIASR